MFSTILAGVDGREGGRDAITLAAALAAATGAQLILAHVVCYELHPARAQDPTARDRTLAMLEREAGSAAVDAQLEAVVEATAAAGLALLARAEHVGLVVVGAAHRGRLGRALIGDDTAAALAAVSCPVAIAPVAWSRKARPLRRLGVAYDDAPESRPALHVAAGLGHALNAPLEVVGIVERGPVRSGERPIDTRRALATRRETARRRAERAVARLPVDASIEIRAGRPEEELVAFSADLDLLVTGSHRRGALGRLLFGSVSAALARGAGCPLLVVGSSVARPLGAAGPAVGR